MKEEEGIPGEKGKDGDAGQMSTNKKREMQEDKERKRGLQTYRSIHTHFPHL